MTKQEEKTVAKKPKETETEETILVCEPRKNVDKDSKFLELKCETFVKVQDDEVSEEKVE